MNENLENTQPTDLGSTQPSQTDSARSQPALDDTQPIRRAKKPSRLRAFFTGFLGLVILIGLGGYGGYTSGISERKKAENSVVSQQLMEQYQLALVDVQYERYDAARQRLEFIIEKDPNYPGVKDKLTEILVLSSIPTLTPTATVTSTPDVSGVENAFQRARQLITAQDWQNALSALDIVRKTDANYKAAEVDGMYYFALRNHGQALILKGNLEGGIYYLTLAERFGPLDTTATQLRDGARMYIIGASFWELDWPQAILYFSQSGGNVWDGEMTAGERLNVAHIRYGNELYEQEKYCAAAEQFGLAPSLDEDSAAQYNKAYSECYPPTPVPSDTGAATEAPTVEPTP